MIPQQLTLKNFLSYREATLDFRGLHTACICGANGAGKSSLLEAMSWAIWGESRVASEDDIVHMGAGEARVDFIFNLRHQTYRIIRTRIRGQGVGLEFQIAHPHPGSPPAVETPIHRVSTPIYHLSTPIPSPLAAEPVIPSHFGAAPSLPHPDTHPTYPFRSLTAKGVRATQQLILAHLKLDYETFINSAYLRQGRADEFMLKRPSDRKQILADLLKLQRYDELAEQAKDKSRQFKGQVELLERNLATIQQQLQQGEAIASQKTDLETTITAMQQQQLASQMQLQTLQTVQQQRQTWQNQLNLQAQQHQHLGQECQRLQQEWAQTEQQRQSLAHLLQSSAAIAAGYAQYQALQLQEETLASQFHDYQVAQTQRQQYQQQQSEKLSDLQTQLQQAEAQIVALEQQLQDLQQILSKAATIDTAVAQLQAARLSLQQLEQLHLQVTPLLKRRQHLQTQADRAHTRHTARLEELRATVQQRQTQQQRHPQLQQALTATADRIATLEKLQAYQQQVREKGLERRHFMERLQAHQRDAEAQLAEIDYKIRILHPETVSIETENSSQNSHSTALQRSLELSDHTVAPTHPETTRSEAVATLPSASFPPSLFPLHPASPYPPCPLCDRPLDAHHWQLVQQKHQQQRQEILDQLWVIREQLTTSEREIQVLRQEYRDLDARLTQLGTVLEDRGRLQEQLQITAIEQQHLEKLQAEIEQLEHQLQTGAYAPEVLEELHRLDRSLTQLNYDEKNHALARGEADRWRWADSKQADIRQAQRRQTQLAAQRLELATQRQQLEQAVQRCQTETAAGLAEWEQQLSTIGYDLEHHNALRLNLRQLQSWQLRQQELAQARPLLPQIEQRSQTLAQTLKIRQQEHETVGHQVQTHQQSLTQTPDPLPQIQAIAEQLQQQRHQLDQHLAQLGRLQQQAQQQTALRDQLTTLDTEVYTARQQQRIWQELAQAFGKNGIQALIIENVLPQLETTTNQILARLSANQLHIQFVTQRTGRTKGAISRTPKLIDTLDILIADAHGTRPYETYSGGEAFRVNFAIRLALARLLAQRSGTALQMLIIDEGFGTQDQEGCDRLIAAINAIAPDFACILTVTHMPYFREAFQARIEVTKTNAGSQLALCV